MEQYIRVKLLSVQSNMSIWATAGSVFGHKDSPATVVGGLPNANHHDPWNRLHGGPAAFPAGPSWAKGADKRDDRDRGKDGERRDIPHIKDEKDRYGTSAQPRLQLWRYLSLVLLTVGNVARGLAEVW